MSNVSQNRVSALKTCPLDVLALVTDLLPGMDLINLYTTNDKDLQRRLALQGVTRRFALARPMTGQSWRFPGLVGSLPCLTTLHIQSSDRTMKVFMVGTMLCLPPSLTDLSFRFEHALTCFMQPVGHPGNNDDGPWESQYKPILLDKLLPNLVRLELRGSTSETFIVHSFAPSISESNFADPAYVPLLGEAYKAALLKSVIAEGATFTWKTSMKKQFFAHLPPFLSYLRLAPFSLHVDLPGECAVKLLPVDLVTLKIQSGTLTPPLKLSDLGRFPNLTNLCVVPPYAKPEQENDFWDAPIPETITKLSFSPTSTNFPNGIHRLLPKGLRSFHTEEYSTLSLDFAEFPAALHTLKLGRSYGDIISILPRTLTIFWANLDRSTPNLKALPPNLTTLKLSGEFSVHDSDIQELPRSITDLRVHGLHDSLTDAAAFLLPPDLVELVLGPCSSRWTSACFEGLPRTLHLLELDGGKLTDKIAEHVPPLLTALDLKKAVLSDVIIPRLPKTITSYRMRVTVSGHLLPEGTQEVTEQKCTEMLTSLLKPEVNKQRSLDRNSPYTIESLRIQHHGLSFLPPSVTSVEYPAFDSFFFRGQVYFKLVHLSLPKDNTIIPRALIEFMPSLTYLSLPNSYQFGHRDWRPLPANLQYLDLSSSQWSIAPSAGTNLSDIFPATLKTFITGFVSSRLVSQMLLAMPRLTHLKLRCEPSSDGKTWFDSLPRSLTHFQLDHAFGLNNTDLDYLPPSLTCFHAPTSSFADTCLSHLPPTLKDFKTASFVFESDASYQLIPNQGTEFVSPQSLVATLNADISAGGTSESGTQESSDAGSTSSAPNKGILAVGKPLCLKTIDASSFVVKLRDDLALYLSPTLAKLTLSVNHDNLTNRFIELLPRSLLHLDIAKQTSGLTVACIKDLPPNLLTLAAHGVDFPGKEIYPSLPRTLTDLELVKTQGRLTKEGAASLPRGLKRLRLALVIGSNESFAPLPSSLTELELPNAPFATNAGVPDLPKGLTRLCMPTAKISKDALDLLPRGIKFLNLGAAFNVPTTHVVLRLKQIQDEETQALQTAGAESKHTTM